MSRANTSPPPGKTVKPLQNLRPFMRPYRVRIALAIVFLVMAALTTLVLPIALRTLIDNGLVAADPNQRVMAMRDHFLALFGVGVALGVFSASRYYSVSWLGERITSDIKQAVYGHVLKQSPEFFETTQSGEVLSRLTADTTLIQTVVGTSVSMGLRNAIMAVGALTMLIITNPYVMAQVIGGLILVVLPAIAYGRRVQRLSRASQDRVADSSAIAAEVLNAVPVVQSYGAEAREAQRFDVATESAFKTGERRIRARAILVAFIISATTGGMIWGLYQGTQAVVEGRISAGQMGQTVVYVILLLSSVAALSEVYGDILRAAGATERLMELLSARSPIESPSSCCCAFTTHKAAISSWTARPSRNWRWVTCASASASSRKTAPSSQPRRWRTSATAAPTPLTTKCAAPPAQPMRTTSSAPCPRATTPFWVSAACACLAGSASASASRAPS
jgi:ATP-binding cassette subfamily B protein